MSNAPPLAALADGTRRSIFESLAREPQSVGSLSGTLPVSRPAVSQHLKVLAEAGLVTSRQEGTRRIYAVQPDGLDQLRAWVEAMWDTALDRFEEAAREEHTTMTTTTPAIEPIVKVRQLAIPPERAFRLFTEGMATWWPIQTHSIGAAEGTLPATIRFDGRIGGRVTEVGPDGTELTWAEVIAWQPPHRLVLAWHPSREPQGATILEVRFTPANSGTELRLEQRGWEDFGDEAATLRSNYHEGWDVVLGRYEAAAP